MIQHCHPAPRRRVHSRPPTAELAQDRLGHLCVHTPDPLGSHKRSLVAPSAGPHHRAPRRMGHHSARLHTNRRRNVHANPQAHPQVEEVVDGRTGSHTPSHDHQHHTATATPPLRLQQRAPKPSIFPSDSDSQHSFAYLCEFPESSRSISLIFVAKSEFSRVLAYPTMRNATKTSPIPRPTAQTVWERVPSPCGPS
jgi:hypothetical protein